MTQLTTIIIDDETESRSMLRIFLSKYCPDVLVVAEASSVTEAERLIPMHRPQLVFLDINMPVRNGFALFDSFPQPDFSTIFLTAYDEFALEAIKKHALDYLLKPINIEDLIAAVEHAKKLLSDKMATENLKSMLFAVANKNKQEKIALPVLDGYHYFNISDIVCCEADVNYTRFYFTDGTKMLVCQTLGNYEQLLGDHGFIRVHHHYLININFVEKYQRGRGGIVFMKNKMEIAVSQRKKDDFLRLMERNNIG